MKSQTRGFMAKFNLEHPIIQSPMAGASTIEMAAIITNNGGLGSIPLGSASENAQSIRKQVELYRSQVSDESKRFLVNLNFFTHDPVIRDATIESGWIKKYQKIYQDNNIKWDVKEQLNQLYDTFKSIQDVEHETIKTLVELKPKIISFHFGIPDIKIVKHLQQNGISVFITATSLHEFKLLLETGADGVVLQGWEAGGHRGNFIANDPEDEQLSTEDLVTIVIEYVDYTQIETVPWIIAAGGIVDSETVQSLLDLGIAGVQLGTVFLPASVSTAPKILKDIMEDPLNRKTIMSPAISGRNLRTVESPFLRALCNGVELKDIPSYPLPYDAFKKLNADAEPSKDYIGLLAGSGFFRAWKGTDDLSKIFDYLTKGLKY